MIGPRIVVAVLVAGWLAEALASRDRDVEAGIAAYEDGRLDEAVGHYDAAQERLGERPEIHFNRGLVHLARGDEQGARQAFQHASEADDLAILASARYELGNMALDAEDWDGAIAAYIECLKAAPDHVNAKWNLELALLKKQQQEEEQEQEQPDQDQDQDGTGGEPQEGTDEQPQEQDDTSGEPPPDEPEPPDEGTDQGQEEPPESKSEPEPQAMEQMDIDKALEQLDAEDTFQLGQPLGRVPVPEKDW